jgi:hypothetical protein
MKKTKRILFGNDIFPNNSIWVIGVGILLIVFGMSFCGVL